MKSASCRQAAITARRSVELADELRNVQAYGRQKLAGRGLHLDDVFELTRRVLKGR